MQTLQGHPIDAFVSRLVSDLAHMAERGLVTVTSAAPSPMGGRAQSMDIDRPRHPGSTSTPPPPIVARSPSPGKTVVGSLVTLVTLVTLVGC